jgi:hypothetical protein
MGNKSVLRWLVVLGLGLLLIMLVVVGGLAFGHGRLPSFAREQDPTPVPGPSIVGHTAQQAFALASELAEAWQEDARLAALRAHWPEAGEEHRDEIEWAFQFFSPSTQRLALFAVEEGEARRIRERLSPYVVRTISDEQWRVDSDEAVRAWWHRGGDYLVARRPDTEISLRLRVHEGEHPRPMWVVSGSLPGYEDAVVVKVDAVDGTVLKDGD